MLAQMPALAGRRGKGSVRKGNLRWIASPIDAARRGRGLSITLRSSENGTSVLVRKRLSGPAMGAFGGVMGGLSLCAGMGVGIGLLASAPLSIALFGLALGPSYLFARAIYKASASRAAAECSRIAESIVDYLAVEARGASDDDRS